MNDEAKKQFLNRIQTIATTLLCAVAIIFSLLSLQTGAIPWCRNHATFSVVTIYFVGVVIFIVYSISCLLGKDSIAKLMVATAVCVSVFAIILYVMCKTNLIGRIKDIEQVRAFIDRHGALAVPLFILFQFLQVTILPIPGSVSVALGVALFGPLLSSVYSLIGILLGSICAFAIGRYVGFRAVAWIVGRDSLQKWLDKIKGKDYLILSIMFLLPMFPDDILCFVAGLSSMSWQYYLIMITITRILSVFSTAFSLHLIPFTTWWGVLIWIVIAVIVFILFWLVLHYADKIDAFIKSKGKQLKKRKK